MKKQVEFSKLLDLGKEDIANLSANEQSQVVGGVIPYPTTPKATCGCGNTGGTGDTITPTVQCNPTVHTQYTCGPGTVV